MAEVSPGSAALGLSTRTARVALVLVWATGLVQALLAGRFSVLGGAIGVLSYALPLLGAILVTSRRPGPLSRGAALMVLGGVLFVALSVLAFLGVTDRGASEIWLFSANSYLAALLIIRRNTFAGVAGAVGVLAFVVVWGTATGQRPEDLVELVAPGMSAALIGALWAGVLAVAVRRERAAAVRAEREQREARAAEAVASASRSEVAGILRLAGPPLSDLIAGRTIEAEFLRELTVVEGAIRDRIRAADLAHPRLERAIAGARARGAHVVLLGAEGAGGRPMPDALADAIIDVVEASAGITIQARGERPGGIVSILARLGDGPSVRILLDEQGQRVNGQIIGT
ncbi:hypothetical protein [Microbacterium sp. USTB-Y]|uniref:hypothetical protein n=1 Tax=Microbacterium sp. USTB-Y TaxID=2823692 RepID=UPI002041DEC3|nr:hypothetical protein [Microbacterium sp. USTB-Y]